MEENKVVKETEHYKLVIGMSSGGTSLPCYRAINKVYGVVEQEFFILLQALINIDQMEKLLTEYNNKDKNVLNLVENPNVFELSKGKLNV
jgi:hypothetical protein